MSIEATIKSLRRQLRDLDQQRAKVMHALAALEALAGAASENGDARKRDSPLVDAALAALRAATKPMPIMELVAAIQKNGVQATRPAGKVRGSLGSALLRRRDLFTKPERGIYGLVEWSDQDGK